MADQLTDSSANAADDVIDQAMAERPQTDVVDQALSERQAKIPTQADAAALARQMTPGLYAQPRPQENGVVGNFTRGVLQNFSGIAGGLEDAGALAARFHQNHPILSSLDATGLSGLAGAVGAPAFTQAAQNTRNFTPDTGSKSGVMGNVVGGLPAALTGVGGVVQTVANTGLQALDTADAQQRAGKIGYGQEALDVIGQTALAAAMSKIGQQNVTGKLLQSAMPEMKASAMAMAKSLAARGAIEGSLQTVNNVVSNAINKYTGINPDQDVTEGSGQAFLTGASVGAAGGAIHEAFGKKAAGDVVDQAVTERQQTSPADDIFKNASFTDAEGKPAPIPAGAEEAEQAKAKARNESKDEHGGPTPDENTRGVTPEEADANHPEAQAVQERIKQGMSQPDANPERRQGERNFTPDEDKALIQNALNDPNSFGRRMDDWKQLSQEGKTLLQKLREQQIAKETEGQQSFPKSRTPNPDIQDQAKEYTKQAGVDYKPDSTYAKVDTDKATKIASDYESMKHDPTDPAVQKSYQAFKDETLDQYNYLKDKGVTFTHVDKNPYASSADMAADVAGSKHLSVFSGGNMPEDHPLVEKLPGEKSLTYNDAFRAVHDYFGHAKEGFGFGPRGEENAWRQHSQMYSPEARGAMTAETRGQNSWVNFGPKGEENRANPGSTTYAEQKAGLLPAEHSEIESPKSKPPQYKPSRQGVGVLPKSVETYANETVRPAVEKAAANISAAWKDANTSLGTGFSLSPKQSDTKLDITQNRGELARNNAQLEKIWAPARGVFKRDDITTSNSKGIQWIENAEATGQSIHPDPATQHVLDVHQKINQQNIADGKKYGVNTDNWLADHLGRLYVPDDSQTKGTGGQRSLEGPKGFLNSRSHTSYGDSVAAAKAAGFKPAFDNPADMLLAKDVEESRFFASKKLLYQSEDKGTTPWVESGKTPGEGLQPLKDRSAQDQRDLIAPKWMLGRLAKLNTYEGNDYIDKQRKLGNIYPLRPGDSLPAGYNRSGRTVRGGLYADPVTAKLLDSQIDTAPLGSAVSMASKLATGISSIQYMGGLAHSGIIAAAQPAFLTGQSFNNLAHGEFAMAGKNLLRGLDPYQTLAREVQKQLADPAYRPELEDIAKRVAVANPSIYKSSILNAKHSWENVAKTWNAGNPIDAVQQGLITTIGTVHDLMSPFVQRSKLQTLASRAESESARGLPIEASRKNMSQTNVTADAIMGFAGGKANFQNQTLATIRDSLFSAGKYMEGVPRTALGATADTVQQLYRVLKGEPSKVEFTPRMQFVLGAVASTMAANALIQIVATKINTGSAIMPTNKDWFHARLGTKDNKGNDERVTIPGFPAGLEELLTKPGSYFFNRLNPVIRGVTEDVQNKDFQNHLITEPGDSPLEKAGKYAGHIVGSIAPRSIGGGTGENWEQRSISRYSGIRFSHPTNSDAEQMARDILSTRRGTQSEAEEAKEQHISTLANEVRNHSPSAIDDLNKASSEGEITFKDRATVFKRSQEPQGLVGLVKSSDLDSHDLMSIWAKATSDERSKIQWTVRRRIQSADVPTEDKQAYMKQIQHYMAGGK